MKLLIALALAAAPSALAMAPYVPSELNGCDEPCADVVTIDSPSFPTIESGTCYVFDGMFPSGGIGVPDGVNCVKITVPSDSGLTRRAQVFGDNAEIVNAGKVISIFARLPLDGTKITNTGTMSDGNPVQIAARPLRPSASEGPRRRLPRAQVFSPSGAEITVSEPGKAQIFANGGTDIIFKCYGADATATPSTPALCP
ncbi:unnamed protein product [Pelagomonas calceolata]|uniref:Uncharacterized protein n=1 Tax=Pelagomonas calceolata TaxID=35677 RepID=A0A8J2SG13_9STRA|nr:unnamed protein product [Pelagomonas calceolata]